MNSTELQDLVDRALDHHKLSIARLTAVFEDQRPTAFQLRREALNLLQKHKKRRQAIFIGITGAPGSGKSTLLGRTAPKVANQGDLYCAVLAVDPSSPISGGALLGDRTRVRFSADEPRLYFRSQASATELGGIGPWTFHACRLYYHLFDCVFVETVGIGQSEIGVRYLADHLFLVLQPMTGDQIQFLKAGVMEVPDAIILNKSDEEPAASRTYHSLVSSLTLSHQFDNPPKVLRASAKDGSGIHEIAADIIGFVRATEPPGMAGKEQKHFSDWVTNEWGRQGLRLLSRYGGGPASYLQAHATLDDAQQTFASHMRHWLA